MADTGSHINALQKIFTSKDYQPRANGYPSDLLPVNLKSGETRITDTGGPVVLAVVSEYQVARTSANVGFSQNVRHVVTRAQHGVTARTGNTYLLAASSMVASDSASVYRVESEGYATRRVGVTGLDTSASSIGAFVYISSATEGAVTLTAPTNTATPIGWVTHVATVGSWMFDPVAASAIKATARTFVLKQTVTSGAGATTNVTVTGIATTDRIVGVFNVTDAVMNTFAITSANNIQSATDTTGDTLLVTWEDYN